MTITNDVHDNMAFLVSAIPEQSKEEAHRLAVLRSYGLLDSPAEQTFDAVTQMMARGFDVPIVMISLMDENRQWIKSRFGLDVCEVERDISFCVHVVDADRPLVVSDMRADARFADNPFVTGEPHVRFYAGAPLRAPEGVVLGTLCLVDREPREFSAEDMEQLRGMAALIVDRMKLQHKERLYRSLIEDSSDLVAVFDELGNVTYQSPSFTRLFGHALEDLDRQKTLDLVHPDDRARVEQIYVRIMEDRRDSAPQQFRFLRSDGEWRILECQWRYRLDDPNINGVVSIAHDVTERVQMEEQLHLSEQRFVATFEQSSVGMAMVALGGNLLRINRKFSEMSGIEIEHLEQHNYGEIVHPDQSAASIENARKLFSGEEESLSFERKLYHQDGSSRWAQFAVSRVTEAIKDGYFLVQVQDIDVRRTQEERLRLLESVAIHANDAILITEAEPIEGAKGGPRILYANEAYVKMSGYTLEEVMGKTPRIMQGPNTDPASREAIRRALKRWKPVVVELINYTKDGTPFWVELSIVPVSNERGWYTHWVSIQRDVTERKATEAMLMRTTEEADRAREEAENANRAKSEFLGRMSHELRTPLNAILGFGQLLEMEEQDAHNRESTKQILQAGRHLLELINEVLDISRIETNQLSLSLEPVLASEVVREALDLLRPMAAQYEVSLREIGVFDSPCALRGDRRRIKQIVLNLLSNAIKYNRKGGQVTLALETRAAADGQDVGRVRLSVTDTGTGIAPEKRERLWVPFDRLGAESTGIEGTGIGLALSYRLAQAMNGELNFDSSEQGSTFWLELPGAELPSLSMIEGLGDVAAASASAVSTRWIALYIEDNLPNVQLMQGILAHRPEVRLLTAFRGELGLELARQHCPDVILLDLHLPDINGDEVLRRLRENPTTQNIPVVMISADATPGQIERLLREGADEYLSKPFDVSRFFQALDHCIALGATQK